MLLVQKVLVLLCTNSTSQPYFLSVNLTPRKFSSQPITRKVISARKLHKPISASSLPLAKHKTFRKSFIITSISSFDSSSTDVYFQDRAGQRTKRLIKETYRNAIVTIVKHNLHKSRQNLMPRSLLLSKATVMFMKHGAQNTFQDTQ